MRDTEHKGGRRASACFQAPIPGGIGGGASLEINVRHDEAPRWNTVVIPGGFFLPKHLVQEDSEFLGVPGVRVAGAMRWTEVRGAEIFFDAGLDSLEGVVVKEAALVQELDQPLDLFVREQDAAEMPGELEADGAGIMFSIQTRGDEEGLGDNATCSPT